MFSLMTQPYPLTSTLPDTERAKASAAEAPFPKRASGRFCDRHSYTRVV